MKKTAMQELAMYINQNKAKFKDTNLYWNLYATAIQSLKKEKDQIEEAYNKSSDYYKDTYNIY